MSKRKKGTYLMSLKEALSRISADEKLSDAPARVASIVARYNGNNSIHHGLRSDIFSILNSAIELAESVLNETYPAEVVLRHSTDLLAASKNILLHVDSFRPYTQCYGLIRTDTNSILSSTFPSEAEAAREIADLRSLGSTIPLKVVPIRLTSQFVVQPQEPPARLSAPPPPPPPPAVGAPTSE